jgi:basic membrane lipoprotein Med (substrate-binding protein (PBP1-ABC) superfamily)
MAAPSDPVVPSGLALVVVLPGEGAAGADQAAAASDAVTVLASANAASVTLLDAALTADANTIYQRALDADPDVVITVGPTALDALQKVAADHPERQFLVVGAQPQAPVPNITAVVWPGFDTAPVAADLAARVPAAVAAGVSEIAAGRTGLVIALP